MNRPWRGGDLRAGHPVHAVADREMIDLRYTSTMEPPQQDWGDCARVVATPGLCGADKYRLDWLARGWMRSRAFYPTDLKSLRGIHHR